ncbi:MMPL family transporter [Dermacoccaceae bacterium W4C1]
MPRLALRIRSVIVGRRTAPFVVVLGLLIACVMLGAVGEGERARTPSDTIPRGTDSTKALALSETLPEADENVAIILFTAEDGGQIAADQEALKSVVAEAGGGPTLRLADDGTAALAVVPVEGASASEVSAGVDKLRGLLQAQTPAGVQAQVTGPAGIQADLAAVFEGANLRLLLVTALVVAVLLVITYRSPVLWVIPLVVVGVADRVAAVSATQVLAAVQVAWDESTVGILSVLVFGAGTNYALLLISRYRDELRVREDRRASMEVALRHTAEAVLTSAATVVVGVLTLLLSLTPTTRGLGLACAVGIVIAAFYALVVLPAALVCFGRWVFWPKVPRAGEATSVDSPTLWKRVGGVVAARPGRCVTFAGVLLVLMSVGVLRISTGLDTAEQFLDVPEAITASDRIAESFPAGTSEPTRILTREDPKVVERAVADISGVDSVRIERSAGGVSSIQVTLTSTPGTDAADTAVLALRDAVAGFTDTHVGGAAAEVLDETTADARDRRVILPLLLLLVFGALALLLRSLLGPAIMVATVVASNLAALGVSWWIFTGVLEFDNLAGNVPLLTFLFLVALGIDYNIFLISRTREEAHTVGTRDGVLRALAATGGVITSAGILLAAVFAVLGVLPLVVLAQVGLVICVGVLIDTLLVRTILLPAIVRLIGERFWWPRGSEQSQDA